MSRRRRGAHINGLVLLDKPEGLSSNQALQRVRRLFNARKGGHTGTLDPFATGMLPLCLGEASKTAAFMLDACKAYRATARFGAATATGDREGEVVEEAPVPQPEPAQWQQLLATMSGAQMQVPPMFSALKHEGKPLYELARQGISVPRKARPVTIHELRLLSWEPPELCFEVVCSKGTYIRTLAEDLAEALGSRAHLVNLRRLWVEPFERVPMVTLEELEVAAENACLEEHLLPVEAGLSGWPEVALDAAATRVFRNGNPASAAVETLPEGLFLVRDEQRRALGIGTGQGGLVQPRKVFLLDAPGGS